MCTVTHDLTRTLNHTGSQLLGCQQLGPWMLHIYLTTYIIHCWTPHCAIYTFILTRSQGVGACTCKQTSFIDWIYFANTIPQIYWACYPHSTPGRITHPASWTRTWGRHGSPLSKHLVEFIYYGQTCFVITRASYDHTGQWYNYPDPIWHEFTGYHI